MLEDDIGPSVATTRARALSRPKRRVGLARRSEEVFSHASPLDLPAAVFAGAVALGFLSFFFGIHSVAYMRADGAIKQVGFLWAPNWTLLFMVFMPLYFVTVAELLVFWKTDGRPRLATGGDRAESDAAWARKVEASTLTNWVVLVICLPFAGLFQWMVTSLLPLLRGDRGNFAMDWGVITLVRPEIISMPASILFTGVAYLYMSLCFYLFFVGLILLYTMADDYRDLIGTRRGAAAMFVPPSAGARLLCGTFRSAILGVLIAICMKLQSAYLTTDSANLLDWLIGDLISVFTAREVTAHAGNYATPTHYSSLLVVVATCAVFLHCALHLRSVWKRQGGNFLGQHCGLLNIMSLVLALLVAGYLLIGTVAGFSILLVIGLLPAVYGLFDPLFGMGKLAEREGTSHVS